MKARALGWLTLTLLLGAQMLEAEPRFRADDGNLWRLDDNPALAAVSGDLFSLGYAVVPESGQWDNLGQDLQLISPFLAFHYSWKDADSTLRLGTELGPWAGLSFGYRGDVVRVASVVERTQNFGLVWRPVDLFSAAATVDDAFGPGRMWGGGLALRPFAVMTPGGDGLTLTADGTWDGSTWAWESWGGRWSWQGSDLRVWYEPGASLPGFEVTFALGPSETTASPQRAGQALRWSTRTPDLAAWGKVILKVQGTGVLAATSVPSPLRWGRQPWDLPSLADLLRRAADDPQVAAVAIEDPPVVAGLAAAQTLRAALDRLRSAGKPVYVHADDYSDSLGFQGWLASADRVALDPSGSLNLVSGGARRLYLKGLFDKVGLEFVNFAPWETKSANNTLSFASMPDGERAMLARFLSDRDDLAAAALASGRGERLKGKPEALVADGPYLVARRALELGLIDALESRAAFETFLAAAQPGATVVDTLPVRRNPGWGPSLTKRTVALVELAGDIVGGPGQAGRSIGRAAAEQLAGLRSDDSIRAVVLRVDSPGGAVLPSDALAEQVRLTVEAGKPVLVVMGDVAASGGYYLSAPATRIFAQSGTLTGSIGVTAAVFSAEKALETLGIRADGVEGSPSAAFGDWTRPLTPSDRRRWDEHIDAIYQRFLDVVAAGRGLDKARLEPLARGQIYTGREALALGLVDELGGLVEAQVWLEEELGGPVEWKPFVPGETAPLGGLLSPLVDAVLKSSDSPVLRLTTSLDPWIAPYAEAWAGVAARGPGPVVWADVR